MKKFTLAMAAVLGLFAGTRADAGITLGISANAGSAIVFEQVGGGLTKVSLSPGNITQSHPTSNSFVIGLVNGSPLSPTVGLEGNIVGPGFTYKASEIVIDGTKQSAELSSIGPNTFQLIDGSNVLLTATISGINIQTDGTGGVTNSTGTVNLTGIQYTGLNPDLIQLRDEVLAGGGIAALSFQFSPAKSLTDLASGTSAQTYSIAVSTVPEPGSMALAFSGVAMLGLAYYRQQRRKLV